jgi:hypothetical protein
MMAHYFIILLALRISSVATVLRPKMIAEGATRAIVSNTIKANHLTLPLPHLAKPVLGHYDLG